MNNKMPLAVNRFTEMYEVLHVWSLHCCHGREDAVFCCYHPQNMYFCDCVSRKTDGVLLANEYLSCISAAGCPLPADHSCNYWRLPWWIGLLVQWAEGFLWAPQWRTSSCAGLVRRAILLICCMVTDLFLLTWWQQVSNHLMKHHGIWLIPLMGFSY